MNRRTDECVERGTVVIGLGDPGRGDDGAGCLAAGLMRDQVPAAVEVHALRGEAAELIATWAGAAEVVLLDAMHSGREPGRVLRFDASSRALPAETSRSSTHSMGLADAIELSRALGTLPRRVIVFGIEAASVAHGEVITEVVRAGAVEAARRALAEVAGGAARACTDR
jgi:hydrogenase maturation protease